MTPPMTEDIKRLVEAAKPFAKPHKMGDRYVSFAPRLIEELRQALAPFTLKEMDHGEG